MAFTHQTGAKDFPQLIPAHPGPAPLDAERIRGLCQHLKIEDTCSIGLLRPSLLQAWAMQYSTLKMQVDGTWPLPKDASKQVWDAHSLCYAVDVDPLGVVLRRTKALLTLMRRMAPETDWSRFENAWQTVRRAAGQAGTDSQRRLDLYYVACALRRQISLSNPLLDFDRLLFVARGNDTRNIWGHRGLGEGRHFTTQYFAFASLPGGGIYEVKDFKTTPIVTDLIQGREIANGPFQGRTIDGGAYLSPELSFDARRLLFAWAPVSHWEMRWEEDSVWQIYTADLADRDWATSLTSGPYNDFDPCFLPDGRIAFISERRGGYVRCFNANWPNRNFCLHVMDADGSNIHPISWFETCEWQPSLTHDGRLVYTRWDYVDRDLGQGQNLWFCYPDGRDPRAPHGNYPQPHYVPPGSLRVDVVDGRLGRPLAEFNIRAVPGSHRYIACAVPQHGLSFGSLIMIDMRAAPDDGHMSQVKRLTPYQPFPESEIPPFSDSVPARWGTPWPLNDDFYLCNYLSDICLLDRFGNVTILCEHQLVPDWQRLLWVNRQQGDNGFRLIDPIPLERRRPPPAIPGGTEQAAQPASGPSATAAISVVNVYDTDKPLPAGVKVKWMRIVQHLVKSNSQQQDPPLGFGIDASGRMSLGIVPVEPDGSVYCEAPVGKSLIFQLLDEDYRAVHSMRTVAFVHRGEHLSCFGCHERPGRSPRASMMPLAFRRPPSQLQPEPGGGEPITYFRTVLPVFQRACLPCHQQQAAGPQEMSFPALKPYVWYYQGGNIDDVTMPEVGGTRTEPGRFGAFYCRMGRALFDEHHRGKITGEDLHKVVLWLDNNSPLYGVYHSTDEQEAGQLVWPKMDVDPQNPLGLERLWDIGGLNALNMPARLSISAFHRLRGTVSEMKEMPDWTVYPEQWDGGPGLPRGYHPKTWRDWSVPRPPAAKPQPSPGR